MFIRVKTSVRPWILGAAVAMGILPLIHPAPARAEGEIGFIEDFALAPDRARALEKLIPGTEDYYFYSSLHAQNSGKLDDVDTLLQPWIKQYGRTQRVVEIENRQALLRYPERPRESLEFLRRRLGLNFNHRRDDAARDSALPTALDPASISRDTLRARALEWHEGTLQGFEDRALEGLVNADLDARRRRDLLRRLVRPDIPNLPALIAADLKESDSGGFGYLPIHQALLLPQLEELSTLVPGIADDPNFVNAWLLRLLPSDDVDVFADAIEREAYLNRLESFTSGLSAAHTALKAYVLYHRLEHDRALGIYNKERFLRYLALPRGVSYMNPAYARQRQGIPAASLQEAFAPWSPFPPVRSDEVLVRDYLSSFFVEAQDTAEFARFIEATYLKELFAETKIVNGLGDAESWVAWLPPAKYQALRDRVDLDFLPVNRTFFQPEETVGLDLAVKNVGSLIVKVFEINTPSLYRQTPEEIGTDINLDGLVAHSETVHSYDEAPLRRIVRHFDLANLKPRGVYVVEFIGNGISSRALVRKGRLHQVERLSSAGHVFTILDESNKPVPSARLWLGGREYQPAADGTITVPFSTSPGSQPIVLVNGDFASLDHFQHRDERVLLDAAFYVDRESLLRRAKATVLVRSTLQVHGQPVGLSVIESPILSVTTIDLDGVSTTLEAPDFKLFEDRESAFEFQVPDRTIAVSFHLKGKVPSLVTGGMIDVADFAEFHLNGIDTTPHTELLHLEQVNGAYALRYLGKTGEPRAGRAVQVSIKHRDFTNTVDTTLQTSETGSIALGTLADIQSVSAQGPDGVPQAWTLLGDNARYPESLHAAVGEVLAVPYLGKAAAPARAEVSLIELRGEANLRDRFEAITIHNGFFEIAGLPAGDYALFIKDQNRPVRIRITRGAATAGYFHSDHRLLQSARSAPVQIESVAASADNVTIQLRGAGPATRVHVFATRFVPAYSAFDRLDSISFSGLRWSTLPGVESLYVSGRNIGDEYRYILDRKYTETFPGNMLARPGLLLNPWAVRETQTGQQEAREGAAWDRRQPQSGRMEEMGGIGGPDESMLAPPMANLDFLADPTVAILNLEPDANGRIVIAPKLIEGKAHLHVVAVSPEQTVYRQVSLPAADDPAIRDLRLAEPLDPAKHFTEQKRISPLRAGERLVIDDITTSRIEIYDSVGKAYQLLLTLTGDETLREFDFIRNWPSLTQAEKLEKYSEFASHELSFFLHEKDPEFFASVVRPYIANKKDKTFLDHWLLGEDLNAFLEPWAYGRLNVVERILLARRIEGERDVTTRHLQDMDDLTPPDLTRLDYLFETALKGSALQTGGAFGLNERVAELEDVAQRQLFRDGMAESSHTRSDVLALGAMGGATAAEKAMPMPAPAMAPDAVSADMDAPMEEAAVSAKLQKAGAEAFYEQDGERRREVRQLYRPVDTTREWAENNYYHLPIGRQNGELIVINPFWTDFARHAGDAPFLSPHLAEASGSFTEAMLALAVIDLPFEAPEAKPIFEDRRFTLEAGGPSLAWHKEVREAPLDADALPVLVTQNFFRMDDRYSFDGSERRDKFVGGEFLTNIVYGCQVVVTNPTSTPAKMTVLLQIPEGALPVMSGHFTRTLPIDLQPFTTQTFEYYFYFPFEGDFAHYPVQVAQQERVVAAAEAVRLKAVRTLSAVDTTSWNYISQQGSADEVVEYLKANNLGRIDLDRIAWRMQEAPFFRRVIQLLTARHNFHPTLWSYGVRHNDPAAVAEFLKHQDGFIAQCGAWLDSPLLQIDPVERRSYEHLEYDPLVNPRAHRLGREHRILNDRFHEQYNRFLTVLAYRPGLTNDDRLGLAGYLLLQDRVTEGMEHFEQVDRSTLPAVIQYDYLKAYLAFYRSDSAAAREIARAYADYPVDKWRKRFLNVIAQADEIESGAASVVDPENRDQTQSQLAGTEPNFDLEIGEGAILIHYANLKAATVNFYLMDVELLFSRNPFVQEYSGQFSSIRANERIEVALPEDGETFRVAIPDALLTKNLMVEVLAEGKTRSKPYYSGALVAQVIENYGQLRVTAEADGKPLPKVYVKAYARMNDGEVRFYKDGYTDLRGRFDYASLSTSDLEAVDRFAILILSDDHGAEVREALPPKR